MMNEREFERLMELLAVVILVAIMTWKVLA